MYKASIALFNGLKKIETIDCFVMQCFGYILCELILCVRKQLTLHCRLDIIYHLWYLLQIVFELSVQFITVYWSTETRCFFYLILQTSVCWSSTISTCSKLYASTVLYVPPFEIIVCDHVTEYFAFTIINLGYICDYVFNLQTNVCWRSTLGTQLT